jgi:hypothetical protein
MDDVPALAERGGAVRRLCPRGRHQPQQEDHAQRGRRETRGAYSSAAPCFVFNYLFKLFLSFPSFFPSVFIKNIYQVVSLPPFNFNFLFLSSFLPFFLPAFLSYFFTSIFLSSSFFPFLSSNFNLFPSFTVKNGQFLRKQVQVYL